MKDRIRQIMEAQHMTQQVFADFIGSTPATLSGIFNDRTRPTLNIVEAIKKKIPDINTDWLMFGQGTMYRSASPVPDAADSPAVIPASGGQSVQDPMFDFEPSSPVAAQQPSPAARDYNSVRSTRVELLREELKHLDKTQRRVNEIRVYYDDQTWESFVPAKK